MIDFFKKPYKIQQNGFKGSRVGDLCSHVYTELCKAQHKLFGLSTILSKAIKFDHMQNLFHVLLKGKQLDTMLYIHYLLSLPNNLME